MKFKTDFRVLAPSLALLVLGLVVPLFFESSFHLSMRLDSYAFRVSLRQVKAWSSNGDHLKAKTVELFSD